jgi:CubicO group peptidase (beta-lactamase class C family)
MFAEKFIQRIIGTPTARKIDALVQAYAKQGRFNGAVLVAIGGEIVLRKGYGYAEQAGDWDAISPKTAFRIGSMSKPFTAIVALQWVHEGVIGLDDALAKYVPTYPNGENITVRHLLSNRSGIEDYIMLPAYEALQTRRTSIDELIALFRDLPPRFAPNAEYGYSNSNWVLLAKIIEQVSGQAFADVMRQRVLLPADMRDSGLDWAQAKMRAVGMINSGTGVQNAVVLESSTMRGGGDIHATLDDVYAFDRALTAGKLLPRDLLALMRSTTTQMGSSAYGLGCESHDFHGHRAYGHSGGMPGFVSNYVHFPDEDITVILLSNFGSAAWESITEGITAVLFDAPYALPTERQFVRVAADVLAAYVGQYTMEYFGRTAVLRFTLENEQLVMHTQGLPKAALRALREDVFFGQSKGEVELTFIREPNGQVNRIHLMWAGYALSAERI